jgi:rfaE bifunctional protein kinase chain/domain
MDSSKRLDPNGLEERVVLERRDKKRVILCQGHFNIVHLGHVRFLQYAKKLGDCLVVAVHGTDHLPAELRSRYFSEQDRIAGVAAQHVVDYVTLLDGEMTVDELIRRLRPDYYVLGQEFERERALEVQGQLESLQEVGGQVVFHSGEVQYSISPPRHMREDIDQERLLQFYQACDKQNVYIGKLKKRVDDFTQCRLLVVGDTIIDSYVNCEAVGMSSEAPLVVAKELETQNYLGGAGIVAAHAHALGASCEYLSVVGDDDVAGLAAEKLREYGVKEHLITDTSRPTTFKTRYLIGNQKVFRLSRLEDHPLLPREEEKLIAELERLAPDCDGIIVSDFNYGVVTQRVIETLARLGKLHSLMLVGDLQCSSQIGDIRRFYGYDLLCPNEREARISLRNREGGLEWIAKELLETSAVCNLILKLGAAGLIAYSAHSRTGSFDFHLSQHFPALVSDPLDVVGAGDSLLAISAISLCCGLDIMAAAALGTCVAALAVQNMGNVPVQADMLKDFLDNIEES